MRFRTPAILFGLRLPPTLTLPRDLLPEIDAFRRSQTPIPNEDEALRRLVRLGLGKAREGDAPAPAESGGRRRA